MDHERILSSLYVLPCAPPPQPAYEVNNTKESDWKWKNSHCSGLSAFGKKQNVLKWRRRMGTKPRQTKKISTTKQGLTNLYFWQQENQQRPSSARLKAAAETTHTHTQVALSSCVKWRTPDGKAALAGTCGPQRSSEDYWTCRSRFLYVSPKDFSGNLSDINLTNDILNLSQQTAVTLAMLMKPIDLVIWCQMQNTSSWTNSTGWDDIKAWDFKNYITTLMCISLYIFSKVVTTYKGLVQLSSPRQDVSLWAIPQK